MPLSGFFKILQALEEKHRRILATAVVFLLVFIISYKIIYKNATKKVAYYKNMSQKIAAQNKLREELWKLDGALKSYEALFVHKKDIDSFKNELSKLTLGSGAKIVSISSERITGPGYYNVFFTTLQLECSYHQLGNLVARIENAEPYIGIKSIKFGKPEAQWAGAIGMPREAAPAPKGDTIVNVNLILQTYMLWK